MLQRNVTFSYSPSAKASHLAKVTDKPQGYAAPGEGTGSDMATSKRE